ncbi:tol-pal system protein YbgF [Pararhodospirillum oryzae]|uniref:Cell division coordinator CpoB n=1 Tax=Pararhodospirillum oryzae TaxID=478448 RepID=A0A512H5C6_9PROT|nr:tol-pal system protein YbgF [Pararhodospirillum oryzae]GEO80669.1 tol-pal system protein YbgF [Pararhodospirillum oryzae]
MMVPPFAPRSCPVQARRPLRLGKTLAVVLPLVLTGIPGAQAQDGYTQATQELIGRLQVRVSELERLVQDLTGRVEETRHQNTKLQQQLDAALGDITYRLDALEGNPTGGSAAAPATPATGRASATAPASGVLTAPGAATKPAPGKPAATAPAAPAPAGPVALPEGSESDQYNYAFSLLRNADYPSAEQALKAFIQKYPKGKLTGNAQYWLGETYYVRGDFEQAAVAFMTGYQTYPDSSKGPDNLLKLGLALGNLGKTREACAAFGRLEGQYPKAADAIKRRAQSEMGRLGC